VRVDAKQLEALKRVVRSSEGRVLQSILAAEHQAAMKSLLSASAENVQRLQGRAILLDELMKLLDPEVE
jgi:hypothetical protein